jgi:5-methylcytosine-specific restriction endonuclease McrA
MVMFMGYREKWFAANKSSNGYYRCTCCGKKFRKEDIDIDHIVPRNRGGTDELLNLQPLCKHCNRSKQDDMSSTGKDLAVNIGKNIIQGNSINNVGGLAVNMVKKNTQNAVKKKIKKLFK